MFTIKKNHCGSFVRHLYFSTAKKPVDHIYNIIETCGTCSCGKIEYIAEGPPISNHYCHLNSGRDTKTIYQIVSHFKPSQLNWKEPPSAAIVEADGLSHLYCACEKKEYMGYDASKSLGVVGLNVQKFTNYPAIEPIYRPNSHIFYSQRDVNVSDNLPKWATIPEGQVVENDDSPHLPVHAPEKFTSPSSLSSRATRDMKWNEESGRLLKDVLPLSPTRVPEPEVYMHTEVDPPVNNCTLLTPEKLQQRLRNKYNTLDPSLYVAPNKTKRDVIIVGGGHNGLVSAAYLAKSGLDTLVLERRHCVGGAAVTEEIVPGFKFSRASYLAGLLRPQIIKDLELERFGFKFLPRNPSSFTPTRMNSVHKGKYLLLGEDAKANWESVAQFSVKDADAMPKFDAFLSQVRDIIQPLLDNAPPDLTEGNWREKLRTLSTIQKLAALGLANRDALVPFYELFTGNASQLLDRWFESEMVKTTLATDAVIGAMVSPKQSGSAYVLLHHVMGEAAGKKGVWAYVEGGMGRVSEAIAASARERGAEIVTHATVRRILTSGDRAVGVQMDDGSELFAETILSGASPHHTFLELLPGLARDSGFKGETSPLPEKFVHHIRNTDFSCGCFKINVAVNRLPNFSCFPSPLDGTPGDMHKGTVHFESTMEELEVAHREASMGIPATRPAIEMTIPSSVDSTLAPPGQHVVQLFVQYAPYDLDPKIGSWADPAFKNAFADRCFAIVEEFCPGFTASVVGRDVISPLDLERIFGLHKGNIFHGSLGLQQLGYARPMAGYSSYRSPLKGLYMCGAGTHPGGGVMGAPGRNCANVVLSDLGRSAAK